jgi:signal transduction histidine kinase
VDISGYPFQPILDRRQLDGVSTDALSRADQEDELADWLEERGFDDPYEMASTFVEVGYDQPLLAGFSEKLLPEQVNNFLQWVHKEMEMLRLANDLQESTSRLQTLVTAVKEYSYMDQGSHVQQVDLHKSLDNTLLVLNHKSKHKGIRFVKEYGQDVPSIEAYGGELNQVWTNLLDNAIDAVPEQGGQITIRTYVDDYCKSTPTVAVEIRDNGSGIPKEIQNRIFEPFFTTKEPGKGTGIGLEISNRIVVGQHKGIIEVESVPGDTKFTIYLPIRLGS